MKFFTYAVLAVAGVQPVLACDFCSVYAASEAQGGGQGFFGGIAEQYTRMNTVQQDGQEVPNDANQYIDSSVSQVFAGYNFNKRFGIQFNVPIISRTYQRPRGSVIESGSVSGVGDISLTGNFVAYKKYTEDYTLNWTLLGGLKFPTGDSSRLNEPDVPSVPPLPDSGIAGHDLALGSGSFDGIIGSSASARWKRVFVNGTIQYAIRTEGDFGHQYADDLTWSTGPGVYLMMKDESTLTVQFLVSGDSKGKDTFSGVYDDDSAETAIYVGPQIAFTWSDNLSAQLGAGLPVSIDNTGVQVVPDYRINAALTWHF